MQLENEAYKREFVHDKFVIIKFFHRVKMTRVPLNFSVS